MGDVILHPNQHGKESPTGAPTEGKRPWSPMSPEEWRDFCDAVVSAAGLLSNAAKGAREPGAETFHTQAAYTLAMVGPLSALEQLRRRIVSR